VVLLGGWGGGGVCGGGGGGGFPKPEGKTHKKLGIKESKLSMSLKEMEEKE